MRFSISTLVIGVIDLALSSRCNLIALVDFVQPPRLYVQWPRRKGFPDEVEWRREVSLDRDRISLAPVIDRLD